MGSSKAKNRNKKKPRTPNNNNFRNFNTLLPVFQSPQGMKPHVLKNLYCLLDHLTTNAEWSAKYAVGPHDFDHELCHDGIRVTLGDISKLYDILFTALEERVEQFLATFRGERSPASSLFDAVEVINWMFKCCMLLLTLLSAELNVLLEKGQVLLRILRNLSLPNLVEKTGKHVFEFEKSVFCEGGDGGCTTSSAEDLTVSLQLLEPCNPHLFLSCSMLEVFVDEMLVHGKLRGYFKIINSSVSINERMSNPKPARGEIINSSVSINERMSNPKPAGGDTLIVIDAICNHFILSFSGDQAFGDFMSRLFFVYDKELRYPLSASGLDINAAVSLLLSPIMVSAPKYIQAHLISLVSQAVNNRNLKPDHKLTNCFLSTFEKSISLYMTQTSCSKLDGSAKPSSSNDISHPPFEFYISPETKDKVHSLITKLDDFSDPNMNDIIFRTKSDLVSSSMKFVKECQRIYPTSSCQDEILAILNCLVLKASESFDVKAISPTEGTNLQHIYLLASLLKLMGISLLQAIRCLRRSDVDSSCKEYGFIIGSIKCFGDLEINLPLQQVLSNVMSTSSTRHMDSKMMFLHFSGLMSRSFARGLDCLVKGCLLTILASLKLFVFEEGSLDALGSLLDSNKESFSSRSLVRCQEPVVARKSSLVIASMLQKLRSTYSSVKETSRSKNVASASHTEDVVGLEEETKETSNGEVFFNCMVKMGDKSAQFDDLVDFVECEPGKNYSAWLKNRQKFRQFKAKKIAARRLKKNKKRWRTMNGMRN